MRQTDKNLLIITLLVIAFIFVWTFSNYQSAKKTQLNQQKERLQEKTFKSQLKQERESLPSITFVELKTELSSKNLPLPLIVDLRSVEAYQNSHIVASIHINDLDVTRTGRNIILITADGNTVELFSLYTVLTESQNQVRILTGGFYEWENSGGITVSSSDSKSFANQAKVRLVEPRDVDEASNKNPQDILTIDVRRNGNFIKGHIPKAINIPLTELEKEYRNIPNKKTIYIYGADELTSFNAGVMLYDLGFFNIKTINGGFAAWQKYNYPTVIEEIPQ